MRRGITRINGATYKCTARNVNEIAFESKRAAVYTKVNEKYKSINYRA